MKKHLMVFAVVLLAVAIAAPAFAAIEFKYGGQFRARMWGEDNIRDGIDSTDVTSQLPYISAAPGAFPVVNPRYPVVAPLFPANTVGTAVPYNRSNNGFLNARGYNGDDNRFIIDQRLRLYFSFVASKNLKVVTKFEIGDQVWGKGAPSGTGPGQGAVVGADSVSIEVKNAYAEFNIPNTPTTAIVGIQTLTLLDSWIVDDDFPAAVLVTNLSPFKLTLGYIGAQSGWEGTFDPGNRLANTDSTYNVDTWFGSLDYASGPFKASLIALFQDAHDSSLSIDPATLTTPIRNFTGAPAQISQSQVGTVVAGFGPVTDAQVGQIDRFNSFNFLKNVHPKDNFLVDLGFNLTYKTDWLMAYVNFVKNLGSVDGTFQPGVASNATLDNLALLGLTNPALLLAGDKLGSVDYEGWMIDGGLTYYCGPWTANVGGFYTTGPKFGSDPGNGQTLTVDPVTGIPRTLPNGNGTSTTTGEGAFLGMKSKNVDWFVYPAATGKYFSEIVGGGILGDDLDTIRGFRTSVAGASGIGSGIGSGALNTMYWRGYHFPTNLWTITAGGSWQVMEKTKLSASYWYFGTAEDVPVAYRGHIGAALPSVFGGLAGNGRYQMSSNIGHELNFYLDQGIVDGLTLTLVGAYLIADDAWAPIPLGAVANNLQTTSVPNKASDAFELGARLQWNF